MWVSNYRYPIEFFVILLDTCVICMSIMCVLLDLMASFATFPTVQFLTVKKQSIKPVFSLFILILIFREDATSALATGFHAGPLSWLNMNLEMLVFVEGGKPKNLKKTLRVRHKTTTNSAHIWHWVGIKSSPHWWEASALTTVPSVLPYAYTLCFQGFHFCF